MTETALNPLVGIRFHVPFDLIRAEHVEAAVAELLGEARRRRDELAASKQPRTFVGTMMALDSMTDRLDYAMSVVRHMESVTTYPELRAAHNAVQPEVAAFYAGVPLHEGLWRAVLEFAECEEAAVLTGARRRFLQKTMDSFRRHGAELDKAGKAKLEQIDVELAKLTTRFSENALDATNAFELVIADPSQLAGLPPSAVEAARENAAARNLEGWRFTLQAPSYLAVMTYLDDPSIRERVYRAYNTRASGGRFDNRSIVLRILELRRAKASLLGYRDFSDFALEDRMARTGALAQEFLDQLKEKTVPKFHQENLELSAFRRATEGEGAPPIQPWDVAYYAEKLRKKQYELDEEQLRPYFPLGRVVDGLFDLVGRLYGIRVEERASVPVWDPQTKYYVIHDGDGTLLGAFYADWHPRENKRGGAWMDSLIVGRPTEGGFEPHLGAICGNLTPPVGNRPALLTHREVETVFHEFGHLLHHCLSKAEVRSFAGTNVAWDFVELPSQIMENWCWERESLDLFARHWETGDPIPEDLFQKMKRARTFRGASFQMRQLGLGFLDLALHRGFSPDQSGDVMDYSRRILDEFSPAPLPPEHAAVTAFTHLFGNPVGYAAGYYSYKWAEVLDADAFTRFRENGIFSREVGMEFRRKILAKGDSEDPAELYRAFMGRDPNPDALLERLGLIPEP